jgi:hypothetical protein
MTRAFPIRWSFEMFIQHVRFFRSDTKQTWVRGGYTIDDAQSLIGYLNTRA